MFDLLIWFDFSASSLSLVNVMRCTVCHQDYKQSDIIDNYFVKDTTEATSTSDEKAAQVCQNSWPHGRDGLYISVSTLMICRLLFGGISLKL